MRTRTWQYSCGLKALLVSALALVLILVSYVRSGGGRYGVIGKTDPLTNSHVEYTVSRNFVPAPVQTYRMDPSYFEQNEFDPKATPSPLEWAYRKLRHQSSTRLLQSGMLPGIWQYSAHVDKLSGQVALDSKGFVDVSERDLQLGRMRVLKHERYAGPSLYVTRILAQWPPIGSPPEINEFELVFIHPQNSPIYYGIVGLGGDLHGTDGIEREVNAIADSVRIVHSAPR